MISRHVVGVIVAVPFLFLASFLAQLVPYTKQGFFCDDDEIRFPFRENTVQTRQMLLVFMMSVGEYSLILHLRRKGKRIVNSANNLHPALLNMFYFSIVLLSSVLAVSVTVTFSKRTICRLRPNFISVCQPNLTQLCTGKMHEFIQHYRCYGKFDEDQYYSFPSGHSAHAVNFGIFMIFYLQKRCRLLDPIKALLQFALFLTSLFVCLSRVRDYQHRLSDVLGGAALGTLFAWFFLVHILHKFRFNRYETSESLLQEEKKEYSAI